MTTLIGYDYAGASAGIVHQDRLVLVGSGAVPDLVMASRTGHWMDFRLGIWRWTDDQGVPQTSPAVDPDAPPTDVTASFVAADSDGFYLQQTSGRGARFHALLQQEGLFVLGDTAESVVPPGAFTADEVAVRENSWFGSELGRTPVIAGGLAVFVQRGGEDVRGIAWTEAQRKYLAESLLVTAGPVFKRAVDMTFQPSTGRQGDTVYVIDEDGSMAVLLLAVGQAHPAWCRWETPEGRILGGAAPLGEAAFLVERDGVIALETLDEDAPQGDGGPFELRIGEPRIDPGTRQAVPGGRTVVTAPLGPARWRREAGGWVRDDEALEGWAGHPWQAEVETLPYVAPKQSGLQRSLRRVRILDVALDVIVDPGWSEARLNAELNGIAQVKLTIVAARSRRVREKVKTHRYPRRDTDWILRLRFGGTRGWRDRIALSFSCPERVSIAGLSYRPVT